MSSQMSELAGLTEWAEAAAEQEALKAPVLRERTAALESLEAPDFTLPDLSGRPHSLVDYRGRKVLLATWASW